MSTAARDTNKWVHNRSIVFAAKSQLSALAEIIDQLT
jgi:hypothetical protein